MSKEIRAINLNIEIKNGLKIIVINDNDIIVKMNNANTMKEKRKIVEKYLLDAFVGKTLTKEYVDQFF